MICVKKSEIYLVEDFICISLSSGDAEHLLSCFKKKNTG